MTLGAEPSWVVAGPATLHLDRPALLVRGPGPSALRLALTRIAVGHDSSGPALDVVGTASFVDVPGLEGATADVRLRWSAAGVTGSATGTAARSRWTVRWDGHDLVPSMLDVDVPFTVRLPHPAPLAGIVAEPGRLRLRGTRSASGLDLTVAVEGGDTGFLHSDDKAAAAAVVLGTAAAAEAPPVPGGVALGALGGRAADLVANPWFAANGAAKVTAARLDLSAPGTVVVDYAATLSPTISAGLVEARTRAPMSVSVQGARLRLGTLALDLSAATLDLTDMGQWEVTKPKSLFQVGAVRSGHGSSWFELDLHFGLDLGPVRVEQATLRIALDPAAPLAGARVRYRPRPRRHGVGERRPRPPRPGRVLGVAQGDDHAPRPARLHSASRSTSRSPRPQYSPPRRSTSPPRCHSVRPGLASSGSRASWGCAGERPASAATSPPSWRGIR